MTALAFRDLTLREAEGHLIGRCLTDEALTRRERLLVAIWEGWRAGRSYTSRELTQKAGFLSNGSIDWPKLKAEGWIVRFGHHHGILPGPRFGGIYQGRPMRIIDDCDVAKVDRRKPKYDRRGVLFEARP